MNRYQTGEKLAWHNPSTGEHGHVTFVRYGDSEATKSTAVVKLNGEGKRVEIRHLARII
jgi:hypothetical protein